MPKQVSSVFGQRMRSARERAGLAQDRLGVMIGIDEGCSSARISRYESGVHAPPFEIAEKIAVALKVPTAYFYCRDDAIADLLLQLHELSAKQLTFVCRAIVRARKQ